MKRVLIQKTGHTYQVTVRIAEKQFKSNLRGSLVEAYIRNSIIKVLKSYVAHRKQALSKSGCLDGERREIITNMETTLKAAARWKTRKLATVILKKAAQLSAIAPPATSRYFKHDTQILNDLTGWATRWAE